MNSADRDQYLEILGITQWQLRKESFFDQSEQQPKKTKPSHAAKNIAKAEQKEKPAEPKQATEVFQLSGVGDRNADCLLLGNIAVADLADSAFSEEELALLKNMFAAIGLQLNDVFNVAPLECLASALRDPQEQELATCYDYLYKHIQKIKPKVIFVMHQLTAQVLVKSEKTLTQLRETPLSIGESKIIVTFSPAHLLKKPVDKAKAWQDLKQLKTDLEL